MQSSARVMVIDLSIVAFQVMDQRRWWYRLQWIILMIDIQFGLPARLVMN